MEGTEGRSDEGPLGEKGMAAYERAAKRPHGVVICVSYYSSRQTLGFVEHVRSLVDAETWAIAVVDNGSEDPTALGPLERMGGVTVLRPGANLGYFGGAQWALRKLGDEAGRRAWYLLANVDLRLESDFFAQIGGFEAGECGVVAPTIIEMSTGGNLNPLMERRPRRAGMQMRRRMLAMPPVASGARLLKGVRRAKRSAGTSWGGRRNIYAAHGCCLLFSGVFFASGGTLEHGMLLYGEEFTLAERARRLGSPVTFAPELVAYHYRQGPTSRLSRRRVAKLERRALAHIVEEYFHRGHES